MHYLLYFFYINMNAKILKFDKDIVFLIIIQKILMWPIDNLKFEMYWQRNVIICWVSFYKYMYILPIIYIYITSISQVFINFVKSNRVVYYIIFQYLWSEWISSTIIIYILFYAKLNKRRSVRYLYFLFKCFLHRCTYLCLMWTEKQNYTTLPIMDLIMEVLKREMAPSMELFSISITCVVVEPLKPIVLSRR